MEGGRGWGLGTLQERQEEGLGWIVFKYQGEQQGNFNKPTSNIKTVVSLGPRSANLRLPRAG